MRRPTPLGAVIRGAVAGAVGTTAMDLVGFARYRRGGGTSQLLDYEFSAGLTRWEDAPAPAQVGKRLAEGFLQRDLPAQHARATNNITHWGYGILWGSIYGLLAGSVRRARVGYGIPLGAGVWANSYAALPLAKLYRPIWEYDLPTLAKDLGGHLVYGLATALTFRLLR